MDRWALQCACGWTAEGTEGEIVDAAQDHGRTLHNMELDHDQAMAMATRLE